MEINFKFAIGDFVTHVGLASMFKTQTEESRGRIVPQKMMVTGRLLDECPAGYQLWYDVRGFCTPQGRFSGDIVAGISPHQSGPLMRLREDELITWNTKWDETPKGI